MATLKIKGGSISGIGTCLVLPEFDLVLDIGFCPKDAARVQTVLITHPHIDHLAGAVQHAAIRDLLGMKPSRFVVPYHMVDGLKALLDLWCKMVIPNRSIWDLAVNGDHKLPPIPGSLSSLLH